MSTPSTPTVGVIVCSSRKPRACPQIADFVSSTIDKHLSSTPDAGTIKLKTVDLAAWNLPMFDGPEVPSQVKDPNDYSHDYARTWSAEVRSHSAFIFVMPQYNWGYPAVIKNAIDYLFHEWKGKPAMIVSYGGHGGGKGAAQLRQVLDGVRIRTAETMPALAFPSREVQLTAAKGEELMFGGKEGIWEDKKEDIRKAFEELMELRGAEASSIL